MDSKNSSLVYLIIGLLSFSFNTFAQSEYSNLCGADKIVDTYIKGMLDDGNNCMPIANTNGMESAIVEVWIGANACGNSLPMSIEVSAGGQSQVIPNVTIEQAPAGEMEYLYRAFFEGSFDEVCISDLNGCNDAHSMTVLVQRQSEGSASATRAYEKEYYGKYTDNADCGNKTMIIGASDEARDITVTIPVHEKSDDGRIVEFRIQARLADGTVVETENFTESEQNAGEDASLYTYTLSNVQADADRINVRVCSPNNNGDSFGIGSIVVTTNGCPAPVIELAGLGNFTFQDFNDSGMYDAETEPVITGVSIYLYNAEDLTTPIDSTVSDDNGAYQFIDLDPNLDYVVQFSDVIGFSRSSPSTPASEGVDDKNDADFVTGFTDVIDLDPGEFDPTIDAGYTPNRGVAGLIVMQGPSINPNAGSQGFFTGSGSSWKMTTDLIKENLIPTTDPYEAMEEFTHVNNSFGVETVDPSLLVYNEGDDNNIVDWLFLELRDENDPTAIVATRSVLLKANGEMVDVEGNSFIQMNVPYGEYYMAVRHRNHLGVMTGNTITLGTPETPYVNFSDPGVPTWGENAQAQLDPNTRALWAGDSNMDRVITFQGNNNDNVKGFFDILGNPENEAGQTTFITNGYLNSDTNLNCESVYQGGGNDNDRRFFNVLSHPNNDSGVINFIIEEQVAK